MLRISEINLSRTIRCSKVSVLFIEGKLCRAESCKSAKHTEVS